MLGIKRACGVLLAVAAGPVLADGFQFGSRTLEVPAPGGFVRVSPSAPRFQEIMGQYIGSTNRLVETWAPAEHVAALAAGEATDLPRYFQLQVLRDIDGRPVDAAEFTAGMAQMEQQVEATVRDLRSRIDAQISQGNQALQESTGSDVSLDVGDPEYLGVFAREPWALFFATLADVTVAAGDSGSETSRLANGSAVVLANHQVLFLYAYADYAGDDDLSWVKDGVRSWAAAVRAANPDDAAVAEQARPRSIAYGIGRTAGIGALIGLGVGVIGALLKRRKPGS